MFAQIGNVLFGCFKHINKNRMVGGMAIVGSLFLTARYFVFPFMDWITCIAGWMTWIVSSSMLYMLVFAMFDEEARNVLKENLLVPVVASFYYIRGRVDAFRAFCAAIEAQAPQQPEAPQQPQTPERKPRGKSPRRRAS